MRRIWDFLGEPSNRAVLGWLGGGLVVIVGGLWAAFGPPGETPQTEAAPRSATADEGVAVGGDVTGSTIVNRP